jgi:hypothetical protein
VKRADGPGFSFALPEELAGGKVDHTNPEFTWMGIWRGYLVEAPFCVIATTRPRERRHLRAFTAYLAKWFIEPQGDGREFDVPGARGARRVDGLYEMELGLAADWIEWMTVVVAADGNRRLVTLTVRSRPGDDLGALHDEIAGSLRLGRVTAP